MLANWASNRRHLPFHPLHRPATNADDLCHLEDTMTGTKLLPDCFLNLSGDCWARFSGTWGDHAATSPLPFSFFASASTR